MTNSTLGCDQFADGLSALLEREVSEETRAAMEAHALGCAECGPLLADLRALRIEAANLPELAPSRDLWSGISARIETPVVAIGGTHERFNHRTTRRSQVWLGLAAAGLVAITASTTYLLTKRAPVVTVPTTIATIIPATPAVNATVDSSKAEPVVTTKTPQRLVANRKPTAEETYDDEIMRLRRVVNARRSKLDTATVAVVDKNLKIIDDAIAQCRMALKKDPASAYLMESLNSALDSKVQLLRTAAALPVRM